MHEYVYIYTLYMYVYVCIGPVCYRKGGPLTVTDANLVLGRIQPQWFPAIFGEQENLELDVTAARKAMQLLTEEINFYYSSDTTSSNSNSSKVYTVDEVAYGFIQVANESMCRPIRNLTTMKGHDVRR